MENPTPVLEHDVLAFSHTKALLEALTNVVLVSRALLETGQPIDINGLYHLVGAACAKVLDLPPPQGRMLRSALVTAHDAADALAEALRAAEVLRVVNNQSAGRRPGQVL